MYSNTITEFITGAWLKQELDEEKKDCLDQSSTFIIAPTKEYVGFSRKNEKETNIFPFVVLSKQNLCSSIWSEENIESLDYKDISILFNKSGQTKQNVNRKIYYCGTYKNHNWMYSNSSFEELTKYLDQLSDFEKTYECVFK
jgi:hypothetical protein